MSNIPTPTSTHPSLSTLKERFSEYLSKVKHPYVSKIASDLNISELEVRGLINLLNSESHSLIIDERDRVRAVSPQTSSDIYQIPNFLDHVRLLLISDTHLASKYDRLDILRYLYDKADTTHTNYILHAGDMTEGVSGRPEQLYELRELSYSGQRDYAVDNYPVSPPQCPTYFISGNHDNWWLKKCGSDICKDISTRRPDLHYLGSDCENLAIGSLRIRLYHGKGGSSYARSYKLQKYLDSIPAEQRPHLLVTGHIHTSFYMKQDKTHCFQTSCLQDLTPYARSLGLASDKSCWWVDVYFDEHGRPHSVKQELETFENKKQLKR